MSTNLKRQESAQEFDAKLSLADFVVGDSDDPLIPPLAFTQWRQAGAWEASIYEPEMLATADARTIINYEGRPRSVINLCSYNYLGLANHPEVIGAARDALAKYGLGACGSPLLSGMTDLHRQLERRVAGFLRREDAMLFNSGFGGALGTISGLMMTAASLFASGSSSSSATNTRSPSCTCGAARPTPWYSCIVSIMSSISF